ncbi:MAG TPA: ATP synthase delta/epsilon chain alpha-helix domain-containing protein [Acidimicrobiales bacterium]
MADDTLFQINLVTPERILLTGMASEVILRTGEGDVTFLAGHTPLVGTVRPGVVRVVRPEDDDVRVAVHGGFTQVEQDVALDANDEGGTGSRVTLLLGVAELAEEIDTDRARVALEAAEARIAELGGAANRTPAEGEEIDPDLVEAEAALLRAQVRLEAVDASAAAAA